MREALFAKCMCQHHTILDGDKVRPGPACAVSVPFSKPAFLTLGDITVSMLLRFLPMIPGGKIGI